MLFSEAIEKYKKWRGFKVVEKSLNGHYLSLRHFCIFLRNPEIEDIKLEQILEWLYLLKEMGFDANTLEKKAIALKKFFEFYRRQGCAVLDHWLVPMPKKEYAMPRVAAEEDYKKLLAVIPRNSGCYWHVRNLALITMLWDSGARVGEIVRLDIPHLDLEQNRAVIKTEKSRGLRPFRELFWQPETTGHIQQWLGRRERLVKGIVLEEPEALFIGVKGGFFGRGARGKRLASCAAGEVFRKYSNRAGLPQPLNAHSLRHHLGHELAKKGANNSVISSILGHSSLQSSYRYTAFFDKELQGEYEKYNRK